MTGAHDAGNFSGDRHHRELTISGSPANGVTAAQPYSFTPNATDTYGRTPAFAVANKPPWAGFKQ